MKMLLIIEIIFRLILPPFYSFTLIEKTLKEKIRRNPRNTFAQWILSNIYVEYKKYAEAISILEALISSDKNNKAALLLLARAYYNLDQTGNVIKILDNGKLLSDKDKENYYLGISLMELGKHGDALPYLKTYLTHHNSRDSKAYVNLGYCYQKKKLYEEALLNYKRALEFGGDKEKITKLINSCKDES